MSFVQGYPMIGTASYSYVSAQPLQTYLIRVFSGRMAGGCSAANARKCQGDIYM